MPSGEPSKPTLSRQRLHDSFIERAWRTGGCALVDGLAASLGWSWITPDANPALIRARELALTDLARMRREPVPLSRPLLILNGYHAWAGVVESVRKQLARTTSGNPDDILAVSFMDQTCFDAQRRRVLDETARWVGLSTSIDIVAHSMGGLVGRFCGTTNHPDGRVLHIERLYTLASPHRGATLANIATPDATARGMRAGSDFLRGLGAAPTTIRRLITFTHAKDPVVGAHNTSLHNEHPRWCSGSRLLSHFSVAHNPIVLATIARELRSEPPLIDWPANPLPTT